MRRGHYHSRYSSCLGCLIAVIRQFDCNLLQENFLKIPMPTYECIPLHLHISLVSEFTLLSVVCLLKHRRDLLFMCAVVVALCDTVLHRVLQGEVICLFTDSIWTRTLSTVLPTIKCVRINDTCMSPSSKRARITKHLEQTDRPTDYTSLYASTIAGA